MADKHAVLIKYKYLDYIENAKLSGSDSWEFMRGLIEYDKTGKEPKFKNPKLTGLFAVLKCDLDENRDKWEDRVSANRENGKKGGRPPKTHITHNNLTEPKKPSGFSETHWGPENPQKPDSGNGSDLDSEFVLGSENINLDSGGGNSDAATKPPPLFFIKTKIKQCGFYLDDDRLLERLLAETDSMTWFKGCHSFIDFIAQKVQREYGDKPPGEQHRVFRKLLFNAPNLREAYPGWRQQQEKDDALKAGKEALEAAREKHPEECGNCGAKLRRWDEKWWCDSCEAHYTFSQESRKWDYHGPPTHGLSEQFRKQIYKEAQA